MKSEINYGPLTGLIGTWEGNKGLDVAPESDGTEERNPYYEKITFEAGGSVTNAEKQTSSVVKYHQIVKRKSTNEVFHDEVGYWLWDAEDNIIIRSFTIPRAVAIVAGGTYKKNEESKDVILQESASVKDSDWEIAQSPFVKNSAKTTAFESRFSISENSLLFYQKTTLDIYGKTFDHTDDNVLIKVVE